MRFVPPLANCFWLVVPLLAFNVLLAGQLPAAFQPEIFWRDIPAALGAVENASRTAAIALMLWMPLDGRARGGLLLYGLGLLAYALSWLPLLFAPESAWSTSAAGFLAPTITPALWLAGIGLVGAGGPVPVTLAYRLAAALFLAAHNAHALLVHARIA